MSGNQWGPPPGQYPQQPPPAQYSPPGQAWPQHPQYGVGQYGPPPGQPQFGWGGPGAPRPPQRKSGGAKTALIVVGVIVAGVVGLAGVSTFLKHNGGSDDPYTSQPEPTYTTTYSPTYSPTVEQPTPTVSRTTTAPPPRPTTTRPAPRPTAPRTTRPAKKVVVVTDLDIVARNRLYKSGAMRSVNCHESSARQSTVAGATANYRNLWNCLNRAWPSQVTKAGARFRPPSVRTFTGTITTPCGSWSDTGPPFYCPSTETIYMNLTQDVGNYNRYSQSIPRTWARMWMLHQFAHEYGHHVQELTGIFSAYSQLRYEAPSTAKELELSRRLELQASCFSDIFIGANRNSYPISGQSATQWRWLIGHVTDYQNDHGDAGNHRYWALRGYNTRNPSACNTYVASPRKVQ
ncbi:neutral zinc metallopeptidase [Kribbella sp. NPDC020789]